MKFEKFNLNPLHKTTDCSIRALGKALNRDWFRVYDDLCCLGKKNCRMPSNLEIIKMYLSDFEHNTCKVKKGQKRPKVEDFKEGIYILRIANHLTCVIDGVLYDTWDCREKAVYRYWRIN